MNYKSARHKIIIIGKSVKGIGRTVGGATLIGLIKAELLQDIKSLKLKLQSNERIKRLRLSGGTSCFPILNELLIGYLSHAFIDTVANEAVFICRNSWNTQEVSCISYTRIDGRSIYAFTVFQ